MEYLELFVVSFNWHCVGFWLLIKSKQIPELENMVKSIFIAWSEMSCDLEVFMEGWEYW